MAQDPMAMDQSFNAGAPMDSLGMAPQQEQPQHQVAPSSGKKLVDMYTAMLFVAAIFLLIGSLALAWEKQRYGPLFGNTWKVSAAPHVNVIADMDSFDTYRNITI